MEALAGAGQQVGEYVGNGGGEVERPMTVAEDPDVGACIDSDVPVEQDEEDSSDGAQPLLILYDCETTGLSIYDEHIIEIAAKVLNCPYPKEDITFSSLVRTARRIHSAGILLHNDFK